MSPTVLITRPDPAGHRFGADLSALVGTDVPCVHAPLMRIEWVDATLELDRVRCLVFTSRNGVAGFRRLSPRRDLPCYCVGDATASAARASGLEPISCGGDAGDLVARMTAEHVTGPCLHLRGDHVASDVANALNSAGIETEQVVVYRQVLLPLSEAAQALLNRESPVIVPLFSPRTAAHLAKVGDVSAPVFLAAMSEAVAKRAEPLHPVMTIVAERPDATAMLTATQGLLDAAKRLEGDTGGQ